MTAGQAQAARRALLALPLVLGLAARDEPKGWAAEPKGWAAEPEPGTFRGLGLSPGYGRAVCARATFDRRTAAAGGRVLVLDAAGPGDEEAIRLSQAVIARRGGFTSRVGVAARRHGVPAVALGQGRWDERGGALYLSEPSYGKPKSAAGFAYRPVVGFKERALREGDAVVVDAAAGRVSLVPGDEAEARLAAAEAALAYDGLRDAAAIEQWLALGGAARRGALLEELIARAVAGTMPAADLARARRALGPGAGRDPTASGVGTADIGTVVADAPSPHGSIARAFARAVRAARRRASDCASDVEGALDAAALKRLAEEARVAAEGVSAVSRILSLPDGGAAAEADACRAAALKRASSRPAQPADFTAVAAAAGADRPESRELPAGSWKRFVVDNGLGDPLARAVGDASLGLRRKSQRIYELIVSGRLADSSPAGRVLTAHEGPLLVVGEDAAIKAEGPADALERVKQVWASSWTPAPLGARLRAGRALAYEGRVRVEKIAAADVSGVAFSRDPGSGRRERVLVEAVLGPPERILAGDVETGSFTLDRRTGRELAPRAGSLAAAALSPQRLVRVARLARALDAWKSAGVEIVFSFSGQRLFVHHVRPLEPPHPILPLNDLQAPRPQASGLSVRPVRR